MPNALITGASQGFGRALLTALVAQGWTCVVDARDARALHEAAAALPGVRAVPGDVTDPGHRADLVAATDGRSTCSCTTRAPWGPHRCRRLTDYPLDALRRVFEVDVVAPLALTQTALPALQPPRPRRSSCSAPTPRSRPTPAGAGTARRKPHWTTSPPSSPWSTPSCGCTPSTPATCAPRCTRPPSPARTSPTAPNPRPSCPPCCTCWTNVPTAAGTARRTCSRPTR